MPAAINAYPTAYHRYVLKEKGKIVKVVDLISDFHIPENFNDPRNLGSSEKALLSTLQKMGRRKNGEKIEFFGETSTSSLEGGYSKGKLLSFIEAAPLVRFLFGTNQGVVKVCGTLYQEFHTKFESFYLPPIALTIPAIKSSP